MDDVEYDELLLRLQFGDRAVFCEESDANCRPRERLRNLSDICCGLQPNFENLVMKDDFQSSVGCQPHSIRLLQGRGRKTSVT